MGWLIGKRRFVYRIGYVWWFTSESYLLYLRGMYAFGRFQNCRDLSSLVRISKISGLRDTYRFAIDALHSSWLVSDGRCLAAVKVCMGFRRSKRAVSPYGCLNGFG